MRRLGTINNIEQILKKYGLYANKNFGQNFLVDQNILERIVKECHIDKNINVIEIGPGLGSLTEHLLENANSKSAAEEMRALWEQITGIEGLPAIVQETIQAQIDANMIGVQTYKERYEAVNEAIDAVEDYVKELQKALSDTATSLINFAESITDVEFNTAVLEGGKGKGEKYQEETGKTGQQVQQEVNEKGLDQRTMAHVRAEVTNSSGKMEQGQITSSGNYVMVANGSTLETYEWDAKTGTQGKLKKKRTIDQLTIDQFKSAPAEAKEALVYAIEHQKPGTLINKNIADLVAAAGIIGKTYKLKNGIYGSISKGGNIYYNQGKEGVQKWNTAKGKLVLEKYNEAEFKKKAESKNIGREYAQVLKKRGVSGYKTGGLADYTGPAWLDGTPSKPELVLNARDTQNFIALKDVLAKAITGIEDVPTSYGDILYEININVDKIEKDYDVDKVVDKVKKEIVKTSGYRNVTQVRNLR